MGTYTSSIGRQLAAFEKNVQGLVRKTLIDGGRRFRSTMNRHWLSKPKGSTGQGVATVSGKLKRSFRYVVDVTSSSGSLEAQLGGGAAPYGQDHEEQHRIQFKATFELEAKSMVDSIRAGLEFFARNPGQAGPGPAQVAVQEGNDEGGGERGALLGQLRQHFSERRAAAKLRRQSKWRSIVRGA